MCTLWEKQDELTLHWGMHTVREVTLWRALTLGAHGEWGRSAPRVAGDHVVHDDTPFHSPQFFHKVTKVRRCLCPKMAADQVHRREGRPGMCRSLGAKCGLQQAIMLSKPISEMQWGPQVRSQISWEQFENKNHVKVISVGDMLSS